MGNRRRRSPAARLFRTLAAAVCQRMERAFATAAADSALIRMTEPLESRTLLSATIGPIVDVVWQGQHEPAIADQYVARTANFAAFSGIANRAGFTNIHSLGGGGFYGFDSTLSAQTISNIASNNPAAIASVQPDFVYHTADTFPSDPFAQLQYHVSNSGQVVSADYNGDGLITPDAAHPSPPYPNENHAGTPGIDDNMRKAWDVTTGSASVVVAVLDTGIDLNHPDLAANIFTNPGDNTADTIDNDDNGFVDDVHGWNFVSDNNDPTDDNGHGTHTAGIIGAVGNNSLGVTGVAWTVQLLPIKVLDANGNGTDSAIIAGINYCLTLKDEGINIVAMNESLAGSAQPFDQATSNAVAAAGRAGIVDVAAAGNDSANLDSAPLKPASFSLSLPNVITVASIDNQGNLSIFSNFGASSVDLAAPGTKILSTSPSYALASDSGVDANGNPVTPTRPDPLDPADPIGVPYGYLSGTSEAAPQVTGIIALEAAVHPGATPAQYKKALLDGVTFDPALASVNGLPAKVRTSGYANAFAAVQNIQNQFIKADTTRFGNWHNFYGTQGAYVVGESTTFPSFVNATFGGASPVIVQESTKSVYAPQKVSDPTDRIVAYNATTTTETINLTFTDGNPHRVGLYVADLDHLGRTELVQIADPVTETVYDAQEVSNFIHGQYLIYDLRGTVQIKVSRLAGPNAIFNAIFFDPSPSNANLVTNVDTTTLGFNWRQNYGSQGQFIVGDDNTGGIPDYIAGFTTNAQARVLRATVNAAIVPQKANDVYHGIAAEWFAPDQFDLNFVPADDSVHNVTLYLVDYGNRRRSERIEAINSLNGITITTQDVVNFAHGVFVTFAISGPTTLRIHNTGGPDAVASAVYFDAPAGEKLQFIGTDNTTMGNWKQAGYGVLRSYVAGQNFPGAGGPNTGVLVSNGVSLGLLRDPSADVRALQKVGDLIGSPRVSAYAFANLSMSFSLTLSDHQQHQLALYFADFENRRRSEMIIFSDPVSGEVLARQRIFNFQHGRYLIYEIRGSVNITIANGAPPNAVISGVFVT
jgi:subtilisin family serine protease